jgi:RNA polymerase sigma factor (sigma-70 family)
MVIDIQVSPKEVDIDSDDFINKLREHDERSFDHLYKSIGGKIYNLTYRMTGNVEDASDITQETFLQVYSHIGSFRGNSSLYTWIFAIARNQCLHLLKNRKRSSFLSFEGIIQEAAEAVLPHNFSESEKKYLADQVKEGCLTGLIRCLSFNQRIAFILHVLLHLPINDIAAIMEKSDGAVKILIHRARMNLKLFLCKNCSLYNSENFCKCENLIGFSLRQGWISQNSFINSRLLDTREIEEEIQNFDRILNFYTNLNPSITPEVLQLQIHTVMASKEWLIFNENKV